MSYYEQATPEDKKEVLEKLLKIKKFVESGFIVPEDATESEKWRLYSSSGIGICFRLGFTYNWIVYELSPLWDEYSGYEEYPVPCQYCNPQIAFDSIEDKWSGEYGESRKRLLNFLIDYISKDLESNNG